MNNEILIKDIEKTIYTINEIAINYYNKLNNKNKDLWMELPNEISFENLSFKDKVYLQFKDEDYINNCYVFERHFIIDNLRKIGMYKVILDLDFKFIDEFFILHN